MPQSTMQTTRRAGPYVAMLAALLLGALGLWMSLNPLDARAALLRAGAWQEVVPDESRATFEVDAAINLNPLDATHMDRAAIFVAGIIMSAVALFGMAGARAQIRSGASLRVLRRHTERLQELGSTVSPTNDTTALSEILQEMLATQCDAEAAWLAGRLTTAHMDSLNVLYGTFSQVANAKIQQLLLQSLLEGGPSPAIYRPEPTRPNYGAMSATQIPPAPAPRAVETPRPVAQRAPEVIAAPVPAPAPQSATDTNASQGRHKKKDRGKQSQGQPQAPAPRQEQPQASTAADVPTARPATPATPAPPSAISAPRPMSAERPPMPTPTPRKLEDWEIEQKYQRAGDEISYFDSGIVSPPRPRRVQAPVDGVAPASAALERTDIAPDDAESEAEAERRRSQLDLF